MTPEEIQAEIDKATAGLKAKNEELLGKVSKFKAFDGVDLDKLKADSAALQDFIKKSEEEKGEYKKLYEALQGETSKTSAQLKADLESAKNKISDMTKRSAVSSALADIKVIPGLLNIAVDNILKGAAVDDSGNVMIDGKTPSEFIKEWSASDVGKHFVANGNSGGGESGGGGDGTPDEHKFFDKKSKNYNLTEQAKIAQRDPVLYNRLKGKYS